MNAAIGDNANGRDFNFIDITLMINPTYLFHYIVLLNVLY